MLRTLVFCFFSTLFVPGDAIIIHPDVKDSKYISNAATAPFFVALGERGSCGGTLVAGSADAKFSYVISAAHCFCNHKGGKMTKAMAVVFFDGSKATVKSSNVLFNPSCTFSCDNDGPNKCDVAIMKLSPSKVPATAQKAALEVYRWSDEMGKTIDTYGYGTTGNAAKFQKVRDCRDAINSGLDGKFRHGQNVITSVSTGLLMYKMDCQSPPPLDLEALSSSGDSGGPAVITRNGRRYLAGVNSGNAERNECDCGTVDQYNRLSDAYADFVLPTIGAPAGGGVATTKPPANTTVCPKCDLGKSGKYSCCARWGAWNMNCGDPGDAKFDHTWGEGIEACKDSLVDTCSKCVKAGRVWTGITCMPSNRCPAFECYTTETECLESEKLAKAEALCKQSQSSCRECVQANSLCGWFTNDRLVDNCKMITWRDKGRQYLTQTNVDECPPPTTSTTTPIPRECSACGRNKKTGQLSCCFRGGAWFKNCGDPGDAKFDHTWFEGIKACKGATPPPTECAHCYNDLTVVEEPTCCGPGGSWFGLCGDDELYSYDDGVEACTVYKQCIRCMEEGQSYHTYGYCKNQCHATRDTVDECFVATQESCSDYDKREENIKLCQEQTNCSACVNAHSRCAFFASRCDWSWDMPKHIFQQSRSCTTTVSATEASPVCPKCGTNKQSGKRSCCFRGGAWFKNCGDPGDAKFDHTWFEGIKACKGATLPPTTTTSTSPCPKCGINKRSGKPSCCGRGGAWFKKCGQPGNSNFDHTWGEGIEACKGTATPTTATVCAKCGTTKKSGQRSCCARGGSWFENCGSPNDGDADHTWLEGITACKAVSSESSKTQAGSVSAQYVQMQNVSQNIGSKSDVVYDTHHSNAKVCDKLTDVAVFVAIVFIAIQM